MPMEEEIGDHLRKGKTPKELIQMGYSKSTVYKVYRRFYEGEVRETYSSWEIKCKFDQERYQPVQRGNVEFTLKNTSTSDLYVYRVGIQPEWMKEREWYALPARILLHPLEEKKFTISFEIPDLPFGEYRVSFGVEGLYLYPLKSEQSIQWSEPVYIHIKMPRCDMMVFISHSVKDMHLIRQLRKDLDNNGVDVVLGKYVEEPGSLLYEKFERLIRESDFFLGIFTGNSIQSKWVLYETEYAFKIGKPMFLLVEKEIEPSVQSDLEYILFRMDEPVENIIERIIKGISEIKPRLTKTKQPGGPNIGEILIPALAAGLIGFLGGLFIRSLIRKGGG